MARNLSAFAAGSLPCTCRRHGVHPRLINLFPKPLVHQQDSQAAKREKELADRRAYLQNFWYAAGECWRAGCRNTLLLCVPSRLHNFWHAARECNVMRTTEDGAWPQHCTVSCLRWAGPLVKAF